MPVNKIRSVLSRFVEKHDRQVIFTIENLYFKFARFIVMRGISNPLSSDNQNYWKTRNIGDRHGPNEYVNEDSTTHLLFDELLKTVDNNASFIDIGCNAGRNLNYLFKKGFTNLAGIEINPASIHVTMKKEFPHLYQTGNFYVGNAAHEIKKIENDKYDIVFSNGVLEHIPPKYMSLFKDMVRVSRRYIVIITSENSRVYPYDFEKIFVDLGCKTVLYRLFYGKDHNFSFPKDKYNKNKHFFSSTFLRIFVKVDGY